MASWASLLAALVAIAPSTELFQRSTPAFRVITADDGLPQDGVQTLALDAQGHLWVGTQGGLAVGEGRSWRTLALPGENTSRVVSAILPASDGSIWVGTVGSGVFQYRGGQWMDQPPGLPSADVHALVEAEGSIWAGTTAGLARYDGHRWVTVAPEQHLADSSVYVLYRTAEPDALWVGTESGLLRRQSGAWTLFDRAGGLPDDRVRSLLETRSRSGDRTLWIGTEGGLAQLGAEGKLRVVGRGEGLPNFPIDALAETRTEAGEPSLWVGTQGGGAAVLRDGQWRVFDKSSGLPDNMVWSVVAARTASGQTILWLGCDEGLVRLVEGGFRSFPDGPPFLRGKVFAMLTVDAGAEAGVWIASDTGLFRFKDGRWAAVEMPVRKDDRPYSMLVARDGALLVGTEQGQIVRIAGASITRIPFPEETGNSVRSMAEVIDSVRGPELWVARRSGLLVRRGEDWKGYGTSDGLKGNWPLKIAATSASSGHPAIWVGSWAGLARFDGTRFNTLDRADGLPDNVVVSLYPDESAGRNELWLATLGGAVRMNLDGGPRRWTTFSERSDPPLPSNEVYTIESDRAGRLYLCTGKGVARLSPAGKRDPSDAFTVTTFAKEDGLPANECLFNASMTDSAGRIWVGTTGGIAVFDPALEAPPTGPRPLLIERTLVQGRERPLDHAKLAYRENALQFEYSLLSYFRDDETRFRTQLVGLETAPTAWTSDGKREFPTLPAGRYEFRVWGRDYAGNISGPVARTFQIARAPWASIWAIALYALTVVGLAAAAVVWRTHALLKRAGLLEEKVAQRTRQLDEKNHELVEANDELVATQRQADRIFSALAEALEGKVIDGRYRLEEKIGQGGFGAVYRATDLQDNVPVAVKVFRPQSGNDSPESIRRFRQEAESGQQVNHKNAVAVLGAGVSSDGILFLVMQLLEGISLKAELGRLGKLPPERAAGIAMQMLDALAEAHRKGVIHRDIKPENVFLHREPGGIEVVKLVDFGVAKMRDESAQGKSMTVSGSVVGTPVYMAPERLEDKPYDGRSDVYSSGIVLYEMLIGRPPFESKDGNLWSLMLMHVKEQPKPPREVDPSIPSSISDAVLAALVKDPGQRPTAERLSEMLSAAGTARSAAV